MKNNYFKIILCVVGLTTILLTTSKALSTSQYGWEKTHGGSDDDGGSSVQQTTDGGYIIAGSTRSYGAGDSDVYLIKTDANGSEVWSKTFGGSGGDGGSSVQQTTDGGYIIVGSTNSFNADSDDDHSDVYLIKTDANGNEEWSKTFGGIYDDEGNSIQQTSDGGYIIAGTAESFVTRQPYDYNNDVYLIKTDANGNEEWSKTFFQGQHDSEGKFVQQTTDGGYFVTSRAFVVFYLIKTDAKGNEEWSKTFESSEGDLWASSGRQITDGGYIVAGSIAYNKTYGNNDVYLIRTDASGKELWRETFGGYWEEGGSSVQQTADGAYIIAGLRGPMVQVTVTSI